MNVSNISKKQCLYHCVGERISYKNISPKNLELKTGVIVKNVCNVNYLWK